MTLFDLIMNTSAGILLYRFKRRDKEKILEIFLVHNGGPFFKNKDEGYWSIPKGELEENETEEDLLHRARIEIEEETGIRVPKEKNKYMSLGIIKQKNNKIVHAFTLQHNWQGLLRQNFIDIEYPKGNKIKIPEVDKAEYFSEKIARKKINSAQIIFIDRLIEKIGIKE